MKRIDRTLHIHLSAADSGGVAREKAAVSIRWRMVTNGLALGAGDVLAFAGSVLVAEATDHWAFGGIYNIPFWAPRLVLLWFFGATLLRLLPGWGLGPVEELRRVTTLLAAVYGALSVLALYGNAVAVLYSPASHTGRMEDIQVGVCLGAAFLTSVVTVPLMRTWMRRALIEAGLWGIPAVVFGVGPAHDTVMRLLESESGMGYTPVLRGDTSGLESTPARSAPQAVAVLAVEGMDRAHVTRLLEGPLSAYRTVIVVPDLLTSPSLWVRPRDLNGVLGLEITRNLLSFRARFTKRASDIALVLAAAPVWVPVCLVVAGLIWLEDRSAPLFTQERIGLNGDQFGTLKFRTMRPDAEALLQRRLASDPELRAEWEAHYKLRDDPRITRVGRLLRGLSLDELPQLINVLRGDMSLVGPRPLPEYHHSTLSPHAQMVRERVRPGITGLWQVSGRSDIGNAGMELWDPYYVRNWSLWLDAVILVRTARAVLARSGAY